MQLGLINSAWVQANQPTVFGLQKTKELGFDSVDIFADPLDIDVRERRLIKDECDRLELPIVSIACVATGLIDFNPSCQRFHLERCERYLDLVAREWEVYEALPAIRGRALNFVYFGGGTPSFLSTAQLASLVGRLTARTPWSTAEEITFECEPGTLTEPKLTAIRSMGVTRLSLGVENFDDAILEANGRAHRSPEIDRTYRFARSVGFQQINIDLIAGMLGETDENWQRSVERTIELDPDSVTIYQMELPYNTTISADKLKGDSLGVLTSVPLADYIDIGIFGDRVAGQKLGEPLLVQKVRITGKTTVLELVVDKEPQRAGIDPYNKLIDRTPEDNVRDVRGARSEGGGARGEG